MIDVVCLNELIGPQGLLLLEFRNLRFRMQDDQSHWGNQGSGDYAGANNAFALGVLTQQAGRRCVICQTKEETGGGNGKESGGRGRDGLVGNAALRHFGSAHGVEVVALSRRKPRDLYGARFVALDLTDAAQCATQAGELRAPRI